MSSPIFVKQSSFSVRWGMQAKVLMNIFSRTDLEEGNGNPYQVKRIRIQSGAEDYGHMQKPLAVMPPFESLKAPKTENAFPGIGRYWGGLIV